MSDEKAAVDFDQIIQADRQRRKNEQLAASIFGNNKKKQTNKNQTSANRRDNLKPPSLASRISGSGGIQKHVNSKQQRSSSTSSLNSPRNSPHNPSSFSSSRSTTSRPTRAQRLAAEIDDVDSNATRTISPAHKSPSSSAGLSIKGRAGPFVVEARNFVPGTSEADIRDAITKDAIFSKIGTSSMVSCRMVATRPVVIVEMVFKDRGLADAVVEQWHARNADGRILEVEIVSNGPRGTYRGYQSRNQREDLMHSDTHFESGLSGGEGDEEDIAMDGVEEEEDVIVTTAATASSIKDAYVDERQAAETNRRDRDTRRGGRDINDNDNSMSSRRRGDDERRERHQYSYRDRDGDRNRNGDRDRRQDDYDDERSQPSQRQSQVQPQTQAQSSQQQQIQSPPTQPSSRNGVASGDNGGRISHYGNGVGGMRNQSQSYGNNNHNGGGGGGVGYGRTYRGGGSTISSSNNNNNPTAAGGGGATGGTGQTTNNNNNNNHNNNYQSRTYNNGYGRGGGGGYHRGGYRNYR